MQIRKVTNRKELSTFIEFPYMHYKFDPVWIPPLRDEQRGQFDIKRNPLLEHCRWQLFLSEDGGQGHWADCGILRSPGAGILE